MEKHGTSLEDTLTERKVQHGPFQQHAYIEMQLRSILERHGSRLTSAQFVAAGMIMHKLARILNGGHQHSDSWHDIAGYATLAEKEILNE